MRLGIALSAMILIGCAKGSTEQPIGDDSNAADAPVSFDAPVDDTDGPPGIDARPDARPDARVDARPDARPDAGNPATCQNNDDCIVPDTCCFFFECVPGLAVGEDACFPS